MNAPRKVCSAPGCETVPLARGCCSKHYYRLRRHGSLTLPPQTPLVDRFFARVEKQPDGCWVWTGSVSNTGYGLFSTPKTRLVHRWSYEHFVEPIPTGLTIDHLCRNPLCVNPEHLEPVTSRENNLRSEFTQIGKNVRKTHCPQGHPYEGSNLYVDPRSRRTCRTCMRGHQRRYRQKRAA